MKYSVINTMLSSVSYKKMVLRNLIGSVLIDEFRSPDSCSPGFRGKFTECLIDELHSQPEEHTLFADNNLIFVQDCQNRVKY